MKISHEDRIHGQRPSQVSARHPFVIAIAAMCALPCISQSETWTLISDCERYGWNTATYSQKYWQDSNGNPGEESAALSSDGDYLLLKTLSLSPSDDYVFPGTSLTMLNGGTMSWQQSKTMTCTNLIVEGGTLEVFTYLSADPENSGYPYQYLKLDGRMTVLATHDVPLRCVSRYHSTGGRIFAAVHGAAESAISIGGDMDNQRKNSLWTFDDTANFRGLMRVCGTDKDLSGYPTSKDYGPWYHYGLKLNGTSMPGTVRVCGRNAVLQLPDADRSVSIGTLALEDLSVLRLEYSATSPHCGRYEIEDSLTIDGTVVARAIYTPSRSVGTDSRPVNTPLLVGPPGVRIDASRFVFEPNTNYLAAASDGNIYPQSMAFVSITDSTTDRDTLYAIVKPLLVKNGSWSFGATSGTYSYADVKLSTGLEMTWTYDPADDDTARQRTVLLDIDDELTIEDGVTVRLNYRPVASLSGSETTNAVLRGPIGVRIDPGKFTFVPDEAYENPSYDIYPQRAHLIVTTDADDRDSLCVVVEPMVVSVSGDPHSQTEPPTNVTTTVFQDGSKWSDKRIPHGNAHYVLRHCGNFPVGIASYVFPGRTLFHVNNYTVQRTSCDVTISNLVRNTVGTHEMGIGGCTLDLRGSISINTNLSISTYASDRLNIHSDLSGSGDIRITPFWSTAWTGYVGLYGDNSEWTGKLLSILYDNVGKTDYGSERCIHVLIRDGRALGGRLPELAHDAVYLNQRTTIHAETNLTLSTDMNRGIWVTNVAAIAVADGCEMSMYWPLTIDGILVKEGAGTLALGGRTYFVDGIGAVTDTPPADISSRTLQLVAGTLKPLNADCLDGLTVVVSPDAGFAFSLAPADAGLRKYGIRDVKTETPFALASDSNSRIPLTYEGLSDETLAALAGNEGLGLVTVNSSAADMVARMLDFRPVRTERHVGFVRRDASTLTGETTFRLYVKVRGGLSVVIR